MRSLRLGRGGNQVTATVAGDESCTTTEKIKRFRLGRFLSDFYLEVWKMAGRRFSEVSTEKAREVFVPGRICLMGEHSDWAGSYRRFNKE